MALMVYVCRSCARCWPISARPECGCEPGLTSVDAVAFINELLNADADAEAQDDEPEDVTPAR